MTYLQVNSAWLFVVLSQVVLASASDLDDFSNNLASDVAPLLALFGEKITIQYFSESTSYLDYLIFAMAPMGIVTAITAAIRVCGDSSLRAFIGRAQEGDGTIEAELCTSTSRDVCELFHRGGITRVFGKPNILEIVRLCDDNEVKKMEQGRHLMGIYLFRDYLRREEKNPKAAWVLKRDRSLRPPVVTQRLFRRRRPPNSDEEFASNAKRSGRPASGLGTGLTRNSGRTESAELNGPACLPDDIEPHESSSLPSDMMVQNPNISINIGIVKLPRSFFWFVALLGLLLQGGVLVMAAVISWQLQWTHDSIPERHVDIGTAVSENRSPMCFIIGTVCLCFGMLACAALIGESTKEQRYQRGPGEAGQQRSRLFWVQPGNQIVGDETFDAFAYIEDAKQRPLSEYTISSKRNTDKFHIYTWVAIILALGGYIAQFIGLRGMNASVSITQLGVTLLMSLLRAILRMRRLKRTDNRLAQIPDLVVGHELDWLAFEIAADETQTNFPEDDDGPEIRRDGKICGWILTGHGDLRKQDSLEDDQPANDPERLLRYRTRLADLTSHHSSAALKSETMKAWSNIQVDVRPMALKLAMVLCGTANDLLGVGSNQNDLILELPVALWRWKLLRKIDGRTDTRGWFKDFEPGQGSITVVLKPPTRESMGKWSTDSARLEGILGLWLWSLKQAGGFLNKDQKQNALAAATEIPMARIISSSNDTENEGAADTDAMENELQLWLGKDVINLARGTLHLSNNKACNSSAGLWESVGQNNGELGNLSFLDWAPEGSAGINATILAERQSSIRRQRFFGWQSVQPHDENNVTHILYTNSSTDILTESCKDIYAALLVALVNESNCKFDKVTVSATSDQVILEEPKISAMIAVFTESGLGSRSDAITCTIPCLQKNIAPKKGESLQSSITKILQENDKDMSKADALLEWVYLHSKLSEGDKSPIGKTELFASGLIAVGEFYRRALGVDQTKESRHSGNRKLQQIIRKYQPVSGQAEAEIAGILARYRTITMQIAIDKEETTLLPDLDCEGLSNVPKESEFLRMIRDRNRTETLYLLCIIKPWLISAEFEAALPLAAQNGWEEVVMALLNLGAVPDTQIEHGRTALSYYCARKGSLSMVKTLLDGGAHPDLPDGNKCTPLWWAAQTGDLQVVKALRDTGKVLLDSVDDQGRSPLSMAAGHNHREVMRLLRDTGLARLDLADNTGRTPFSYAAENGCTSIVEDLTNDRRVDPDSRDNTGRTPLSWAAGSGRVDMVKRLIDLPHIQRQSVDVDRKTPLLWAVEKGCVDVVRELCLGDGRPQMSDIYGLGPLARAARLGSYDMVKELLNYPHPSEEPPDDMGRTALWWACRTGDLDTVKLLHTKDAFSIDVRDRAGHTPLWWAARDGKDDIVKFLLDKGANPATTDFHGETPVLWATRNGHTTTVHLLLATKGSDPDRRGSFGRTPLIWAARRGDLDLVMMLLRDGKVNARMRDDKGRTAMFYASSAGNEAIVTALRGLSGVDSMKSWIDEEVF